MPRVSPPGGGTSRTLRFCKKDFVMFERMTVDEQPFGETGTGGATVARLVGGERLADAVDGDTASALRRRAEHWARARGFVIADSCLTHAVDGVTALVPFYAITEATAVVRGTAVQRVDLSLVIEPRTWNHRLRARFGGKPFATGDAAFDRAWHVEASDAGAAHQILDAQCRETVRDAACWCRVVYERGAIEVRVDDEALKGSHVLSGIELVLLFGRARVQTTAYR